MSSAWKRALAHFKSPRSVIAWIHPVLSDKSFWIGLASLTGGLLALILLVNLVVMPVYTRSWSSTTVPAVDSLSFEEAAQRLEEADLRAERRDRPYNPAFPRDIVMDQQPAARSSVKTNRVIYLFVNSGPMREVTVPAVLTMSEGLARAELRRTGLMRIELREDTVFSPYKGTVTRQHPRPGATVMQDQMVTLWTSPGLGDFMVIVPDVTGLEGTEAKQQLLASRLWTDPGRPLSEPVTRQDPAADARVRAGTEVELYDTTPLPEEVPIPDDRFDDEGETPRDDGVIGW
jgi:hypothetical protein